MSADRHVLYLRTAEEDSEDLTRVRAASDVVVVDDVSGALEAIAEESFTFVVLDEPLGDEVRTKFRDTDPAVSVVIVTGDTSAVLDALRLADSKQPEPVWALERQKRVLESLHETTESLFRATDIEEAAQIAVEQLSEGIERDIVGIWQLDREADGFRLAAAASSIGELPSFEPKTEHVARRAFEGQETIRFEEHSSVLDTDIPLDSGIVVPLGEFGIMIVADRESTGFEAMDVTVLEVWATTVTMALLRMQQQRLLRERESELEQQRDRLERFASIVSHDLRTPLTVASGYIEIARKDHDSPELQAIERALAHIETMINDMLTLARKGWQVADPEAVPIDEVAHEAWDIAGSTDAQLSIDTSANVMADRSQFRHLLQNVFSNAVTHGGEGVTVRLGTFSEGFFVADDGPGIPEDDRENVFDTGFTSAEEGTGFGLAIVEAIAATHGWDIAVTDSAEGGARFDFHGATVIDPASGNE